MLILSAAPSAVHSDVSRDRYTVTYIQLSVEFDASELSPRELRQVFVNALRIAAAKACITHMLGRHLTEELWRAIPDPEAI
jgi:hypothetical protein